MAQERYATDHVDSVSLLILPPRSSSTSRQCCFRTTANALRMPLTPPGLDENRVGGVARRALPL